MTPDTFFSGQQNSKIKHLSKIPDEVSFLDVTGASQMGGGEGVTMNKKVKMGKKIYNAYLFYK